MSLNTIIDRAGKLECHYPSEKKPHVRQTLTASIGALVLHDGTIHRWSPFAVEKWTLIISIDDYSGKILFADFFPPEATWVQCRPFRL